MNKNNMLTRFNTGSTHEQNPLSGIPIGGNNSVEENETKQNDFVYSNRIFLDSNVVSQYNLPKSLVGKSVADATKYIDDKFKGRNDKISQSTKNGMLSKIAEAQEAMKPQEPEMEQDYPQERTEQFQMAYGGNINRYENGQQLGDTFVNTAATGADMIIPGSGQLLKMGDQLGQSIGNSTGGNRGESIGGLISPMGTLRGLGSALKTGNINDIPGIGIFGGKTSKQKLDIENANNLTLASNKKFSDQYSLGGILNPTKITKQQLQNTTVLPNTNPTTQSDRFRYAVGEQGGVQHGTSGEPGHYLYYGKKPGDAGFNPAIHREFVNQGGYDTYMRSPQGQQYRRNLSTQSLQPKQMAGGGPVLPKPPTADYETDVLKNFHNEIGITPDTPGYGKLIGKGSALAYNNWAQKNYPDHYRTDNNLLTNFYGSEKSPTYTGEMYSKYLRNSNSEEGLAVKKALNLTPEGYKFTPETPVFPQKGDPIITPTQTKAGFEAYANAKQVEDAKKNKSLAGKALSYTNDNLGNLARYAPIAANALQLSQLKKPQGERLDRLDNRYKPEYVDEAQLQNIANQTMNNTVNAVSQSGASQGQTRASILGSQLERTKALSDAYSQAAAQNRATNDRAQTFNLGVDQVNLNQSNVEKENFAKDKGNYDTQKSKLIGQLGNDIGNVGKEEIYKKIAKTTTGYSWLGEYQKMNPNATPEETKAAAEKAGVLIDDKKTVKKQALGGYLIKNKK